MSIIRNHIKDSIVNDIELIPCNFTDLDLIVHIKEDSLYGMEKRGLPKPDFLLNDYIYAIDRYSMNRPLSLFRYKTFFKIWGLDTIYKSIDECIPDLRNLLINNILE